jgi:cytochrome b561
MRGSDMTKRGRFDAVSIVFHWGTVLMFVPLLASVYLLQDPQGMDAAQLLDIHRGAGALILAATCLRFLWRRRFARLPAFPEGMGRLHRLAVTGSEYTLYVLLFAQPLIGIAMTIARGRPFDLLFWQVPALMVRDKALATMLHTLHQVGAYTLLGLIGIHAVAALIHHFILRDDILTAMLPATQRRSTVTAHLIP